MIFAKGSSHWKSLIPLFGIWVIFIVSRSLYAQAGIEFQGDTYLSYWQLIDPKLLRGDLWRNVFFLHSQPPLFNLFTGIVLQVFPVAHAEVFRALYFILGILLGTSIYLLGVSVRFPTWLAVLCSVWFVVSPGTVLYENWLMYAYPLTVALTLAAVCLYRFINTKKIFWGVIFFSLLGGMALTWRLFHILWLFGFAAILFLLTAERKKTLLAALLPLLLVTAWYGKNLVTVGEFTASSWAGMNLSKVATFRITEEARKKMVKSGYLSKFALILPFRNPLVYLKLLPETPLTGIPVLDAPETSLLGRNHHHLVYVEASEYYLRDALHVIRANPQAYLRSVGQAVYIYFHSVSDFDLIAGNRDRILTFDLWWNRVFYGQWRSDETSTDRNSSVSPEHVGWWIVTGFLFVAIGSLVFLWRNRQGLAEPINMLVLFMAYNIFFVTVVGNLMDIGENNRFRFTIDPLTLITFVFLLRSLFLFSVTKEKQTRAIAV